MTAIAPAPEYAEFNDVEYTNLCQCSYCEDCGMGWVGTDEPCDECGGNVAPDTDCHGCFEEDMDDLRPYFEMWVDANDSPCGIAVVEDSLIWSAPGRRVRIASTENLRALSHPTDVAAVDSMWTQTWTMHPHAGGVCRIVTAHHDSLGSPVELRPMVGCLDEDGQF